MKKTLAAILIAGSMSASFAGYNMAACTGCHGAGFEKKAMGKSKVVKDMSKADIVASLQGYKDGTYGGAMKGLMLGQVQNLSGEDIEAIATEIKQ